MFVAINGVRLFFDVLNPKLEIAGDSLREKPVLVCLHGGPGGDHQSLRPFFDRFAALAQVVYLDQRGGGRSEAGDPAGWTLDQWGDDVAAFCDALGIVRPIILGVSGGAIVAQAYLARHPAHAGGAILVNACARMDRAALIAGFHALGGPEAGRAAENMYTRGAPEDVPPYFRHCLPLYSRGGNFDSSKTGGTRQTFNFTVSQSFFGPGGEAFRYDHRGRLGAVGCPVLVLAGAHDPVTHPEWGREVAESLPAAQADLVVFEGSSHMIVADEPDRFCNVVDRFIAAR
jgi:proline iminopeptidase